jgi:hypothetical protein
MDIIVDIDGTVADLEHRTALWLHRHVVPARNLYMRKTGDF